MPRGVVIAVTPSKMGVGEEDQNLAPIDTSAGGNGGAEADESKENVRNLVFILDESGGRDEKIYWFEDTSGTFYQNVEVDFTRGNRTIPAKEATSVRRV